MNKNVDYYNQTARDFFQDTVSVDMKPLHERFLAHVSVGGRILDAGCGSGRDAKAFADRGFTVSAFDASSELAKLASELCGSEVPTMTFADVDEQAAYDGIWCCASLVHVPLSEMPETLAKLWRALKSGGCLYASYKLGTGERTSEGRVFTDADEETLRGWFGDLPELLTVEMWVTEDQRPDRTEKWLNAIVRRRPIAVKKLITGGQDHFLPHLSHALSSASNIDIAVAFIKTTGLRLLLPDLLGVLTSQGADTTSSRRVRILTSDYLDVTDPEALRLLLLLQENGAEVRVYTTKNGSFHLKAYIFSSVHSGQIEFGTAFIGSSNISRQALTEGLEWNYRVVYPGDDGFLETRERFEVLFAHPNTLSLSDSWIEEYERRRMPPLRAIAPGSQEQEPPPEPTSIQKDALEALRQSRDAGFRRGLVVLATGLGKTWLAAFDSACAGARRILFVAHREEILVQAAQTFVRLRPKARVGFYMGRSRDAQVDVLCASVQTLARAEHLERFPPQHFDYVVIDEFHHAAASTYRRLLSHFAPPFLLGLTATPDRTDQSDILSLCDDNLVFTCNLFAGIEAKQLAPFHYYGIDDESVNYHEIPWRNGKFDPEQLSNKLATLARARHALREWRARAQQRTLAFCVSVAHADYMASQFNKAGVASGAVYSGSQLGRGEALESLQSGQLSVIFSVDLFNEGVDLPTIDTVMMLRPSESKILFLQQLGRGLRRSEGKQKLVVLDFIGNHHSFLQKPQALFGVGATYNALAEFGRKVESGSLALPNGCYVNYDLKIIEFLKALDSSGPQKDYEALKNSLRRRPTITEFYYAGSNLQAMRQQFGGWFEFVGAMHDLSEDESLALTTCGEFLREIEITAMTKSYKMVLLEALLELDGLWTPPTLDSLASKSWDVMQRRHSLLADLPDLMAKSTSEAPAQWRKYWLDNPVNAWIGGNRDNQSGAFFGVKDDRLTFRTPISVEALPAVTAMTQELVNYRLVTYGLRRSDLPSSSNVFQLPIKSRGSVELPYFPNLKIACGHFKAGKTDAEEHRALAPNYGQLIPSQHFIAKASGNSMDGGTSPIRDGDYLLLELVNSAINESLSGKVVALERPDISGPDNQYLLRNVKSTIEGEYQLRANNPEYPDIATTSEIRAVAKLKAVIDPLDLVVGQSFMREQIPALFGESFNAGAWHAGHVVLNNKNAHVLLITLNKQGKAEEHRFHDYWNDDGTFHWQSQNSTSPTNKRGQQIINHSAMGITIHLFVRDAKLLGGKAAPFTYHGKVRYVSHVGSQPMSVTLQLGS